MSDLIAYGAYVPYHRLRRADIAGVLGGRAAKGARAVASYDEDTTSMGVEAARAAVRGAGVDAAPPASLLFATATPAYLDKTNATAIAAALGWERGCLALDAGGAIRSGLGAILAAADSPRPALAVVSDLRTGMPGGADERDGGDGAAAFWFAPADDDRAIARVVGRGAVSAEYLDRWRVPGEPAPRSWEERFGEHASVPAGVEALSTALDDAGVAAADVDVLVVAGPSARACRAVAAKSKIPSERLADDLTARIGNAGAAQLGLMLAAALDRAKPNETIAAVLVSDGAAALVLRTGAGAGRVSANVEAQIAAGREGIPYATFLTWRGMLDREPPRRPDPVAPAAPPAFRARDWKFGLVGSACQGCGMRHLPPARVCVRCGAVDRMRPERFADRRATVATYTIDRLAYTPSPPLIAAVLDFEGGGRFQAELTDVDPDAVAIGDEVEMTFRRLTTVGGVHNYFWKARPARSAPRPEREG